MKKRVFFKNKYGLAVMYDAVFFLVTVSLSGAILIPALSSDVVVDASVEKHREKTVDEALLMLMTSRVDNFEYKFAGTQIDSFAGTIGIDTNDPDGIYSKITNSFLGKEQIHKTYADLCVENLVSQLEVYGCRVNILTEDYDNALNLELSTLLREYLKDKYEFNLTIKWQPINGIEFGGKTEIGEKPPSYDTHVAKSYVTMPSTYFSDFMDKFQDYVDEQARMLEQEISSHANDPWDEATAKEIIYSGLNDTIYGVLFDGYEVGGEQYDSLFDTSFDFAFEKVQASISSIFGNALTRLDDFLQMFGGDLSGEIELVISDNLNSYFNINIEDFDQDGYIGINDLFYGLRIYASNYAKDLLEDILDRQLNGFVDDILKGCDSFSDIKVDSIQDDFSSLLSKYINPLRAEFCLTIWEVRS